MVRFADALGLDLEDVRHVLNAENPPKIPASAMADLKVGIESDRKELGKRFLTPCFQQPGASENFLQRVIAQKVCLENAIITAPDHHGGCESGQYRISQDSTGKIYIQ